MTTIKMFEVGGHVRDILMGIPSKDIDFSVEADSFDHMLAHLEDSGFKVFVSSPEHLTVRAHFPKDHPEHGRTTADFVLCRKESGSLDGRHPEHVEPGTIFDDLARRDFTVNAIAKDLETGQLIDPHCGQADIAAKTLRFVGNPEDRIAEDALRVLRAIRFTVTKGFDMAPSTVHAILSFDKDLLLATSTERVREELEKCFKVNTVFTMRLLNNFNLFDLLFSRPGLRLSPTMKD